MKEYWAAGIVLVLVLASAAVGLLLQGALRERHRSRETTDAVRLVISILVTFTALVLGLVTSSVKSSYDQFDGRLRGYASDLTELDQRMREYGEGADPIRAMLRTYVAAAIADTWRDEPRPAGAYPVFSDPTPNVERQPLGALLIDLDVAIRRLAPDDDFHRKLADILSSRMTETMQQRWLLVVSLKDTISAPMLILMTGWLVMIFGVFGLSSPRNGVVYATILMCALSLSSAVYLIVDLDSPLDGWIQVSSAPMRDALSHIDAPK
jgi:hypothetical protein